MMILILIGLLCEHFPGLIPADFTEHGQTAREVWWTFRRIRGIWRRVRGRKKSETRAKDEEM